MTRRGLLAGAAALALAGCGSNTGRNRPPGITQWYHAYGEDGVQQAVQRYAADYRRTPVTVRWIPGDYDSKLASGLLSGVGPDVFEATLQVDMIRSGQVADLTDIIEPHRADFAPAVLSGFEFGGRLYGVPQTVDAQFLFYRKSMLQEAGVRPPETLPELVDAAGRLTGGRRKGLFLGNNAGSDVLGGPLLWSVGLDFVSEDHKQPGFAEPEVGPAVAAIRDMFARGHLLLGAPTDWSSPAAITQGLCAMQWGGLWIVPELRKTLGDDFGILPWPPLTAKPSVPIGAFGSMISPKTHVLAEAKDYVRWLWLDRTDLQADFTNSYGLHIPARQQITPNPVAAEASSLVNRFGRVAFPVALTAKMRVSYRDALTRIIRAGADPRRELQSAAEPVRAELRRLFG
ncbi:extracellular solute-binding protein [Pseudonocardiaceae bacterium YIM PH 21723]|nr:extracellular solute-binding protein [Pseudonocardiaceae bacterium YIM PH 21723]